MQIRDFFHKKISFKLADATLFYVASIVIFSFLAYVLCLWQVFYSKQADLQIVAEQNPGVALVTFTDDKKGEQNTLNGLVTGNKVRFVYGDQIITPNKEGRFALSLPSG